MSEQLLSEEILQESKVSMSQRENSENIFNQNVLKQPKTFKEIELHDSQVTFQQKKPRWMVMKSKSELGKKWKQSPQKEESDVQQEVIFQSINSDKEMDEQKVTRPNLSQIFEMNTKRVLNQVSNKQEKRRVLEALKIFQDQIFGALSDNQNQNYSYSISIYNQAESQTNKCNNDLQEQIGQKIKILDEILNEKDQQIKSLQEQLRQQKIVNKDMSQIVDQMQTSQVYYKQNSPMNQNSFENNESLQNTDEFLSDVLKNQGSVSNIENEEKQPHNPFFTKVKNKSICVMNQNKTDLKQSANRFSYTNAIQPADVQSIHTMNLINQQQRYSENQSFETVQEKYGPFQTIEELLQGIKNKYQSKYLRIKERLGLIEILSVNLVTLPEQILSKRNPVEFFYNEKDVNIDIDKTWDSLRSLREVKGVISNQVAQYKVMFQQVFKNINQILAESFQRNFKVILNSLFFDEKIKEDIQSKLVQIQEINSKNDLTEFIKFEQIVKNLFERQEKYLSFCSTFQQSMTPNELFTKYSNLKSQGDDKNKLIDIVNNWIEQNDQPDELQLCIEDQDGLERLKLIEKSFQGRINQIAQEIQMAQNNKEKDNPKTKYETQLKSIILAQTLHNFIQSLLFQNQQLLKQSQKDQLSRQNLINLQLVIQNLMNNFRTQTKQLKPILKQEQVFILKSTQKSIELFLQCLSIVLTKQNYKQKFLPTINFY